jgi:hypothetical protein
LCFSDSAKVFLGMRPLSLLDMSGMSSTITPLLCTCSGTTQELEHQEVIF